MTAFTPRWIALAAALASFVVACGGDDGGSSAAPAYPRDGELRLNQIQVLGSHNSYHIQPAEPFFSQFGGQSPELTALFETLEYTHPPLAEQFSSQGIRQIELDVFADPGTGGLYADPLALKVNSGDPNATFAPLLGPGLKVLHVQEIDYESTCHTFVGCLQVVRDWSEAHPGHVPLMILIEAKDDILGLGGFVVPAPIGAAELDALDAEIRSVFPAEKIITPDEVRGSHATLLEAIRTDGWPTLAKTRGRVLFALDNGGDKRAAYLAGHPSLAGRILFTDSEPPAPEAAFVKLNDAVGSHDHIRDLVAQGLIVRTRADADTIEARRGSTTTRDAALSSGAQFVSTDYPEPDPRFGTGYFVAIPEGSPARCNPVNAPPACTSRDIENPDHL